MKIKKSMVEIGIGVTVLTAIAVHWTYSKINEEPEYNNRYYQYGKFMTDNIFVTENGIAYECEKPADAPVNTYISVEMNKHYTDDIMDDSLTGSWK